MRKDKACKYADVPKCKTHLHSKQPQFQDSNPTSYMLILLIFLILSLCSNTQSVLFFLSSPNLKLHP